MLYGALREAHLSKADLDLDYLLGANLSKDLSEAVLIGADLIEAVLKGADLRGADLNGAEGITNEELEQTTNLLKGVTMPDDRSTTISNKARVGFSEPFAVWVGGGCRVTSRVTSSVTTCVTALPPSEGVDSLSRYSVRHNY